jgi:hypothetical protein
VIPTGIRLGARTLGARRRLSIRQWQENAFFFAKLGFRASSLRPVASKSQFIFDRRMVGHWLELR